jgi:hypothetical protein
MKTDSSKNGCENRVVPRSPSVYWLQGVTALWTVIECTVGLLAAARAHSPALLAFGSDSLVELLSASVVLLQFLPRFSLSEQHAGRVAGILLFALAAIVTLIAVLSLTG